MMMAKPNIKNKMPEEILTASPAMVAEKKGYHVGNSECYIQTKLKEGEEAFRKTNQTECGIKPPDGGL